MALTLIFQSCAHENRRVAQPTKPPAYGAGITEVTFRRGACYGPCASYQVTFEKNGCAIYDGYGFVPWIGHFTGYIYSGDFDLLARLIEERGFFTMQHTYGNFNTTDIPHYGLSVLKNGVRTSVKVAEDNYGRPQRLYELGEFIDGVVFRTKWWGKAGKKPYPGSWVEMSRPAYNCSWSREGPLPFGPFYPNLKHSP